jgi:hypothetical protein
MLKLGLKLGRITSATLVRTTDKALLPPDGELGPYPNGAETDIAYLSKDHFS